MFIQSHAKLQSWRGRHKNCGSFTTRTSAGIDDCVSSHCGHWCCCCPYWCLSQAVTVTAQGWYLGRLWSRKELQTLQHQCSVHQPWHKKVTSTTNASRDFWMRHNLCFLGKREEVVLASLDGVWRGYRHFCLPSFTSFWASWFQLWELSKDWAADRPRLRQNEHFSFNQPDKEGTVLSKEHHDGKDATDAESPPTTRRGLFTKLLSGLQIPKYSRWFLPQAAMAGDK